MRALTISASTLLTLALVAPAARADFTPPKDGKLTEKQVTSAIDILKDQMDALRAAGKATEGSQSAAANFAIGMQASQKLDAAVAKHGMTKDEYNWISNQLGKLWPLAAMQEQWETSAKPDLEKRIKEKEAEQQATKTKIATYEQAQKDGKRVLTKEQRDSTIESAKSDRDSIAQEVKDRQTDLKAAQDEVALHEKEAADAEALAKNPPADVSADDRADYITGKKNDAQSARDAAKDSKGTVIEAQKALDDAKARLTVAEGRIKNPDVPVTDDEKAQATQDNQQAIEDAKKTLDDDTQTIATLKETLSAGVPKFDTGDEKPDPDNLALVRKHIKEYLAAIGASDMLKAK